MDNADANALHRSGFSQQLRYRKHLPTCGAPKKSIMQLPEFCVGVARTLLAQHHEEDDADLSGVSEEEDNSKQGKKTPSVSLCSRANAHLPEVISLKTAACWENPSAVCVTCKCSCACKGILTVTLPFTQSVHVPKENGLPSISNES